MPLSPLLPIAANAFGPLAAQAANTLTDGLGFADVLRGVVGGATKAESDTGGGGPLQTDRAVLENLRRDTQAALKSFGETLRQKLAAAGIDTTGPIELKPDGQGGVLVGSAHPQRGEIEQLLENHPGLIETFNLLAANFSLLHAADQRLAGESFGARADAEFRLLLDETIEVEFE